MAFQRTSVGIDIGTHAIKVAQLKVTETGAFVQNGIYLDRATLASRGVSIDDRVAVAALLKDQMVERGIPTRGVILGISGSDSILRYTAIPPVPAWRLKVIMGYEVNEVASRVGESLASDFQVLSVPREDSDEQVVLVGLSKEESLAAILDDLESAGIVIEKAIPAPVALYAAFDAFGEKADIDNPEDDLAVLVDIGRTGLSTVLVLNDHLVFARSVSFGGETFTESIARDLGVDVARAEAHKIRHGTLDLDAREGGEESQALINSLRGSAAQLQSIIQSSLRFCRSQTGVDLPAPTRVLLVGGGARLRGLTDYLHRAMRKPVERFQPAGLAATGSLPEAAQRVFARYPGDYSVALGLAVSGVRETSTSLNILPEAYRERRRFRDRTVFLYVAGVFLIVALILGAVDGWLQKSAAQEHAAELESALRTYENYNAEMSENIEQNTRVRERINRVLREVEVTAFQSFLLDFFQQNLRPEIRFSRIRLEIETDGEDTDLLYQLVLEGTADNSNRQALGWITELQERLAGESRVAAVEIGPSQDEGNTYKFQMFVRPAFQGYQG